ncbi:hypothetical protein M011DRAFT_462775 [Sporormia fimetaria CBS 119925]|uniref:RNA-binding domain-containing protein n=1 Tax=Sporormia fimetaria CBS 119925 TaxID=1340428 RepID=A0A6A6UYB7_9PLEO|nr:hypothetical protein M011DRAFT_462775 [Sporormia fimetaria CBS 119925]
MAFMIAFQSLHIPVPPIPAVAKGIYSSPPVTESILRTNQPTPSASPSKDRLYTTSACLSTVSYRHLKTDPSTSTPHYLSEISSIHLNQNFFMASGNMTSQIPNKSFAQRQMEKMGHVEGKGLGKAGNGIADPIQATLRPNRAGLGYPGAEGTAPSFDTPRRTPEWKSNIIVITNLEPHAEPAYVARNLHEFSEDGKILKILTQTSYGRTIAYVTFANVELAQEAVEELDGNTSHANYKLKAGLVPEEAVPKDVKNFLLLSDYLKEKEKAITTSTVLITKLPVNHTQRNINELLEDIRMCNDDMEDEEDKVIIRASEVLEPGVGMIQFGSESAAECFVEEHDGTYWKNAPIYVKCVPDSDMQEFLKAKRLGRSGPKDVCVLALGLKAEWAKVTELKHILGSYTFQNANFSTKCDSATAFIFLTEAEAAALLTRHPKGLKHQGKWIALKLKDQKDKTRVEAVAKHIAPASARAPAAANLNHLVQKTAGLQLTGQKKAVGTAKSDGPCDVRVNNLAPAASKEHLRTLFKNFKTTKVVVVKNKGLGYVGLETRAEAQRAAKLLSGKQILNRTVSVTVV